MFNFYKLIVVGLNLMLCIYASNGQSYNDILPELDILITYNGGESSGGCSFIDFDGDGLDDLTICQNGSDPLFFRNTGDGFESIDPFFSNSYELSQITWVDFDNDGDKDLTATSHEMPTRLFRNDDWIFTQLTQSSGIEANNHSTFGHSWGDYNNDGWLDLYICNYDYFDPYPNQLYRNNADGTFTEVAESVGVSDFANFSFQAVWLDYNDDGWQDVFVINDRLLSENHLYKNVGGTFEDVSQETGVEMIIFSMSNTVGDYDNDGDMDIYVTNNPTGHLLHQQQDNGTFAEVADAAGVATYDMGWAAQWIDYDNDGWQDLHVNCSPFWSENGQNKFFINDQDGTFHYDVSMGFDNDEQSSHSSALGDWNNDGMFDIFVLNDFPDVSALFSSEPGPNNYLKVKFEGVVSNRDGIGTKAVCQTGDLSQIRYTYCGEGYLSQNSSCEIFGLGTAEVVDSLTVTWLSGHVDHFYNLSVNKCISIIEGSSLSLSLDSNVPYICQGDSLLVTAPDGYDSYLWSTGEMGQSIYVTEPIGLTVTGTTAQGIEVGSPVFEIIFIESLSLDFTTTNASCFGTNDGMIVLDFNNPDAYDILWNNDSSGVVLSEIGAGDYSCSITDSLGCSTLQNVSVFQPELIEGDFELINASCFDNTDGSAACIASGGIGSIEIDWDGFDPLSLAAGDYLITLTDSNLCAVNFPFEITHPEPLIVNLESLDIGAASASVYVLGGTPPFIIEWSNGQFGNSATDLVNGENIVSATDANNCEAFLSFDASITHVIDLEDFQINFYPNPVAGDFLTLESTSTIANLVVYQIDGAKVLELTGNHQKAMLIDVSHLSSGAYVLKIMDDSGRELRSSLTRIK